MPPTISLCMIVRDEADHLATCLQSAAPWVDEIVIVDTGSRDASGAIARRFGARVVEKPWTGDFAAARNHSLDLARHPWILVLDGDEELEVWDHDWRQALTEGAAGFHLPIQLHPEWTASQVLRLFRNQPGLRYRGIFHERLPLPTTGDGTLTPLRGLRIRHRPYDDAMFRKKRARNVEHLERHRASHPLDAIQLSHLARIRLSLGEFGAARLLLDEARIAVARTPRDEPDPGSLERRVLALEYELALAEGMTAEAELALCRRATRRFPHCPMFTFGAGRAALALGAADEAERWYLRTFVLWRSGRLDRDLVYREVQIGPGALLGAARASLLGGGKQRALGMLETASRIADALPGGQPTARIARALAGARSSPRCVA